MKHVLHREGGATLVEVMTGSVMLGIVILVGLSSYKMIQRSIQTSKSKNLAANLVQEKMQIIKQQSYHRILPTETPTYEVIDSTTVAYDTAYYPPETVLEGGVSFRRLTFVQVAQENSGVIQYLPPSTPDTGLKSITVTVAWSNGTDQKMAQIRSLIVNPNIVATRSAVQGVVRNGTTLAPIVGANVVVAENAGWTDNTNGSGGYSIGMQAGNYELIATAAGYFTGRAPISVPFFSTVNQTINLVPMSSGTVRGNIWTRDHLVVSQVVASSVTAATGYDQEYIELFNPTTSFITIGTTAGTHYLPTGYLIGSDRSGWTDWLNLTIVSTGVPAGEYYLIANTTTIRIANTNVTADAYYTAVTTDSIRTLIPSDIRLYRYQNSYWTLMDTFGWRSTSAGSVPPIYETLPFAPSAGTILDVNQQLVRTTTPNTHNPAYGPAYDSNDNRYDFLFNSTITTPPRNTLTSPPTIIAGTPAVGATISVNDGLSSFATAVSSGTPPVATFTLAGIATGTWTAYVTNGGAMAQIDNLVITPSTTVWIPNNNTSPAWPASSQYDIGLTTTATQGIISGSIRDIFGNPISGMTVRAGSLTMPVNSNGSFNIRMTTGTYTVTANPGNAISSYVSADELGVTVLAGAITSGIDFSLSQGGRIRGTMTRDGINGLAGIGVTATTSGGSVRDQQVSGTGGQYLMVNLATGTYTIDPVLDSGELSNPLNTTVTVTAGATAVASTFTITGAYGSISGNVSSGGSPIKTGAIIVVTTSTISGSTPPTLNQTTLATIPYYITSSYEDGTYNVSVRGSTASYRVYGYYPYFSGSTPGISTGVVTGVTVTAGQTTSNINFSW